MAKEQIRRFSTIFVLYNEIPILNVGDLILDSKNQKLSNVDRVDVEANIRRLVNWYFENKGESC